MISPELAVDERRRIDRGVRSAACALPISIADWIARNTTFTPGRRL